MVWLDSVYNNTSYTLFVHFYSSMPQQTKIELKLVQEPGKINCLVYP